MKKRSIAILIGLLFVMLGAAAVLVVFLLPKETMVVEEGKDPKYFAYYTEEVAFQKIPVPRGNGTTVGKVEDYGDHIFVADVDVTDAQDYWNYLETLKQEEFQKYADNKESTITEYVQCATYTKGKVVVTVTYLEKANKIYISAGEELPLSKYLLEESKDDTSYTTGAKNTLHMLETFYYGNSFLLQLKNGHFVMCDGGNDNGADLRYLIDYMESLTPEGEKPIIDAWFISHAHGDHGGVFGLFQKDLELAERIYVEGVYFSEVSKKVENYTSNTGAATLATMKLSIRKLKDTNGNIPQIYRPHTGERYYFGDVTIDVVHTQEQLKYENYYQDLNDSSLWLMYNVDGQRFLNLGDADYGSMETVMFNYDATYFDVDLFNVSHHGINVANTGQKFGEFINYDVALYSTWRVGSQWKDGTWAAYTAENQKIIDKAKECFSFGNGTVVLEFPYALGSGKMLGRVDWEKYTFELPWEPLNDKSPYYVKNF